MDIEKREMKEESKVLELINRRRSVRKYRDKPVERKKIIKMIEAARLAPSASNGQPWRFFVVDSRDNVSIIVDSLGIINTWAKTAPVIIVGCSARKSVVHFIGEALKGVKYYLLDLGIAMEHIVLAATEMGLSTCWIGWFDERKIRKLLHIPTGWKVVSLLAVGYAEKNFKPRNKKTLSLEEILFFK